MSDELSEKIRHIVEGARCFDEPPPNESTTCDWVIHPMLMAIGYARREIVSRLADNNGQYPDYAILPESDHCWFLEAKAWNVNLQDSHAQQSLNYANQNGRRWVVLSNGREWRLYDNQVQGRASDKLLAAVRLQDHREVRTLLEALRRESVRSHGIARYALRRRLIPALAAELSDARGPMISAMLRALRRRPGLECLSSEDLVTELRNAGLSVSKSCAGPTEAVTQSTPHRGVDADSHDTGPGAFSLAEPSSEYRRVARGRKPEAVALPGGREVSVTTWRQVAVAVVEWVGANYALPPLPYRTRQRGHCYFLNTSPEHVTGRMLSSAEVAVGGRTVHMDIHQSAEDLLTALRCLCASQSVAPGDVVIRLRD